MWESSHCKLPGNRQKASCTTKALRKVYTELGRKRREAVRLEPAPPGGDLEEKGDFTGGDLSWEVSCSSHMLGSDTGTQVLLAGGTAGETHRSAAGSPDSGYEALRLFSDSGLKNPLNGCLYSLQSSPGTCSSLKRAKAPASFISHCTGTQDWGLPGPHTEEELSHERWRRLRLEAVSERSGGSCYWLLHRLQGRGAPSWWQLEDHSLHPDT